MWEKTNLIWILSDQHRFCDVGYAGNKDVETPNLDLLCETGVNFTNAYSSCPLCVPARGSLLTGLHALGHGAAANDLPIRPGCESIATVLGKAGYETAYIGKWHLGGTPREAFIPYYNRLDFKYWRASNCNHNYLEGYYDDNNNIRHPIEGYAPVGETDLALKYLETDRDKSKPFALFLNFGTPHDPYFALPPGDLERYKEKELTLRGNCRTEIREGESLFGNYDPHEYYAGYYAHIRQLDIQIGRVIEKLKQDGMYENTIILYTSDHGDMLGSHGYLNKQLYYEESARVPFLISWPGHIEKGTRRAAIGSVDVAPTILGLLDLGFSGRIDGRDLSDIARDSANDGRRYVYFYSYVPCHQAAGRKIASWRAVSDGEYMLVTDHHRQVLEMYDLKTDPLQEHDCKNQKEYQDKKDELLGELDKEVALTDGYVEWKELLREKGLMEQWEESNEHFDYFLGEWLKKL